VLATDDCLQAVLQLNLSSSLCHRPAQANKLFVVDDDLMVPYNR